MSTATPTAAASPGTAVSTPASTPETMNATVTAFGDQPSRANTTVAYGETRRMYSRPAQCSSLSLASTCGGWPMARTSASVGPDIIGRS